MSLSSPPPEILPPGLAFDLFYNGHRIASIADPPGKVDRDEQAQ